MSFWVSLTFHHHDIRPILPDIQDAGMGQEYDCDKPPYSVQAALFTEGWYLIQADGDPPDMSFHVRLVES